MALFPAAFAQLAYCPFNRSDVAAVLRRAIVITEKTTDAQTATNRTIPRLTSDTVDEFVAEPLMRPLPVAMSYELRERATEVPLAEWDDAGQTFFLDGTNKSLRIGIAVGRAERNLHDPHARRLE